jgi:hypothetical protein
MAGPECDNDMNHHHAHVSCHGDQLGTRAIASADCPAVMNLVRAST